MYNNIDIDEAELLGQYPEVLKTLLRDHTTGRNIFWATDSYAYLGRGYSYGDELTPERIVSPEHGGVIRPRTLKSRGEQAERTKGMAEVFTPSWICNQQNNLIDDAWFGRSGIFNTPSEDGRSWRATREPIAFTDDKPWQAYVRSTRMEFTCGEAPYLVSRYDAATGEPIELAERIGMLDRKLRVVSENTETSGEWLSMAQEAYKHIYAYEWQGDSLLLAREALLWTFVEYYLAKFGKMPLERSLRYIAYIISWNVWQMDGLRGVVPDSCEGQEEALLFGSEEVACPACQRGGWQGHLGTYCQIRDWGVRDPHTKESNRKIRFIDLIKQ